MLQPHSHTYILYIYRSENQYCTDIAINFTCCITQTGKKVKAAELNGAEDISQQFSDEVSGELKMYRKTSQPACKQVGTFFFGKYNCQLNSDNIQFPDNTGIFLNGTNKRLQ